MKILRFILPFLFVRNWYDGIFELSRMRLSIFGMIILLIVIGLGIVLYLHAPIKYSVGI